MILLYLTTVILLVSAGFIFGVLWNHSGHARTQQLMAMARDANYDLHCRNVKLRAELHEHEYLRGKLCARIKILSAMVEDE